MKRLFFIILVIAAFGAVLAWQLTPSREITPQNGKVATRTPAHLPQIKSIIVNDQTMGYAFIVVNPRNVSLIPNFTEQKTSQELIAQSACRSGVNGGFYDTENRPLGLFIVNGQTLGRVSNSTLINGFFSTTDSGAFISRQEPDNPRTSIQTGPLLIVSGQSTTLSIRDDEHARRMVAAVTSNQNIIFLALYQAESVFDGPLMEELPAFVSAINKKEALNITDAINLDGGSASAFYSSDTTLSELTSIGSFFCVK